SRNCTMATGSDQGAALRSRRARSDKLLHAARSAGYRRDSGKPVSDVSRDPDRPREITSRRMSQFLSLKGIQGLRADVAHALVRPASRLVSTHGPRVAQISVHEIPSVETSLVSTRHARVRTPQVDACLHK